MAGQENPTELLTTLSDALADAVERAGKSVVAVDARRQRAASGIVWPAGNGVIVTADHVVERDEDISVLFADGQKAAATLAGRDPGSDVAVLRLAGTAPASAELAPPESAKIGNFVLALGRPGGTAMASFGIVSALGGPWRTGRGGTIDEYIRADVTLYPGFSGGPLVDTQGRVIGLNSWHLARGQEIAIPTRAVATIVQTLLTHGTARRAYLGVTSQPVQIPDTLQAVLGTPTKAGLMLVGIEAGSPAEKGGLLLGDILVAVAGRAVSDAQDLQAALGPGAVGKPVTVSVIRGGARKELTVTPGERG